MMDMDARKAALAKQMPAEEEMPAMDAAPAEEAMQPIPVDQVMLAMETLRPQVKIPEKFNQALVLLAESLGSETPAAEPAPESDVPSEAMEG